MTTAEVVRTGGIAGVKLVGALDTAELPPREAGQMEAALDELDRQAPAARPAWPDSFQYELTVTRGGRRRTVVLDESRLPAALRPLVDMLVNRGRPAR